MRNGHGDRGHEKRREKSANDAHGHTPYEKPSRNREAAELYTSAFSKVKNGVSDDPWRFPRVRVAGVDDRDTVHSADPRDTTVAFYLYSIEHSALSIWLRESPSLLVFPTILTFHTLGMAFLVGTNAAIGLRILGVASQMRIAPMAKFFPLMWAGFCINVVSGVALLIAYPTKALTNPVFYLKLSLIALGVVTALIIRKQIFGDPNVDDRSVPIKWKILAGTSLLFWGGAIVAGRLLPHTYVHFMTESY